MSLTKLYKLGKKDGLFYAVSIDKDEADQVLSGVGGGNTIYSADDKLTGNRIVDLDGNSLSIQQGGENFLLIDPTAGSERVKLIAFNPTDDDNTAYFEGQVTDTDVQADLRAIFNGGVKSSAITAFADATTSTLTYTADSHTFNGLVFINTPLDNTALFQVSDLLGDELITISQANFRSFIQATDQTAAAKISLNGNSGGNADIELRAENAAQTAIVFIDANAQTITLTAANGVDVSDFLSVGGTPGVDAGPLTAITSITVKGGIIVDIQGT